MADKIPGFILIHCANNDRAECSDCGRDFMIPTSAISAAQHSRLNTVNLFVQSDVFGAHNCIGSTRMIRTTMAWGDFIAAIDGDVLDVGEVRVIGSGD